MENIWNIEKYEKYENFKDIELDAEQETFYNCSPGKTQEHGIPLHKTEEESAQKEEESPSSGQGRPWGAHARLLRLRVGA